MYFVTLLTLVFSVIAFATPGDVKWSIATQGTVYSSPAIGHDGTIYVGSADSKLYAINPNGTIKWIFPTSGEIHSSPSIGQDGTIYIGSNDNSLYAVNPNGSYKWRFFTDGEIYSTAAIGVDGVIYIGSYDNTLYAIWPNGFEKWHVDTPDNQPIHASPAIGHNGEIIYATTLGTVEAINPDGTVEWTGGVIQDFPLNTSFAIGNQGNIFTRMSVISQPIGSVPNAHFAAMSINGTNLWEYNNFGIYEERMGSIVVNNNSDVLFLDNAGLTSLTRNGVNNWIGVDQIIGGSSPVVGKSGLIYVGGSDSKLYAYNSNGSDKWSISLGGGVYSSPNIANDGTLYVGADDRLYAIETESLGIADSSWPVFGGNNKHTNNVNQPLTLDILDLQCRNTNPLCDGGLLQEHPQGVFASSIPEVLLLGPNTHRSGIVTDGVTKVLL
jgi:outer membrane protein assembly factor BamB